MTPSVPPPPVSDTDTAPSAPAPAAPISCETAVRRLWDYLDGGLAAVARAEVDDHLAACAHCPPHFAFSARTLALLAAARSVPEADDAALRDRVLAVLHGVG